MSQSEAPHDGGIVDDLRRWRRTDDVEDLRMRIQRALKTAETIMYAEHVDVKTRLKAVHAVVTAAREARKTIETHELEERLERLEQMYQSLPAHSNGHHA